MELEADAGTRTPDAKPDDYKRRSRRKASERPRGADRVRQAFSKRKKGLVLKSYQLCSITDAKVVTPSPTPCGGSTELIRCIRLHALLVGNWQHVLPGILPACRDLSAMLLHSGSEACDASTCCCCQARPTCKLLVDQVLA